MTDDALAAAEWMEPRCKTCASTWRSVVNFLLIGKRLSPTQVHAHLVEKGETSISLRSIERHLARGHCAELERSILNSAAAHYEHQYGKKLGEQLGEVLALGEQVCSRMEKRLAQGAPMTWKDMSEIMDIVLKVEAHREWTTMMSRKEKPKRSR